MSAEKSRDEAARWYRQARADIEAAESSRVAGHFEWACFQAQQAGEKALKALWYAWGADPWGHSLARLIDEFPEEGIRDELESKVRDIAAGLDKDYIPSRYPNGLPDLTPTEVYTEAEAVSAIQGARAILDLTAALGRFAS